MASKSTTTTDTNLNEAYVGAEEPKAEDNLSMNGSELDKFPEGGLRAWLVAAGAAGVLFATMGFANSFGIFEAYYLSHQLQTHTTDDIAWIGSLQSFLQFAVGMIAGPFFDRYGAWIIRPAAVVYLFGIMMTSLCSEYWQFMLAQGVVTGLALGFLVTPSMAATAQYFNKRRGAAMGIALAGSSAGSVVLPIALGKMLNESSLGYGWTMRIAGFIVLPFLVFSCLVIRTRLPPRSSQFIIWSAFRSAKFDILIFSTFLMFIGMFTPIFYLPSYALLQGMSAALASYLIAMLNGASIFGRIIPGILADKLGRFNILSAAGISTGIVILCWTQATTNAGLICIAVFFGFTSGAIISGGSTAFAVVPSDPRDIGTYMGMGMGIGSVAALIGPPVNGALYDHYGSFEQVSMFSGVMCLAGGIGVLLSKYTTPQGLLGKI